MKPSKFEQFLGVGLRRRRFITSNFALRIQDREVTWAFKPGLHNKLYTNNNISALLTYFFILVLNKEDFNFSYCIASNDNFNSK